ncbi:GNAT family N-acetyltransferase [Streptomyces sp. NPDC002838]|uniref:GNAT family N-acetyltransferase n=1 Tax=Streptomyces sp. NPDC002838 TaxID=3154436 RepID=UPI00332F7E52
MTAVRLEAAATPTAPALLLRPWCPSDAADLVGVYPEDARSHGAGAVVHDDASAAWWVREQRRGWEAGERFGFAVVEFRGRTGDGRLVGHVILKRGTADSTSAEVGYWTAAHARGRSVAPRAVRALTDWAFGVFSEDEVAYLELLHQVDNTASCRVARKCGYAYTGLLPAAPPEFPLDGHRHAYARHQTPPATGPP